MFFDELLLLFRAEDTWALDMLEDESETHDQFWIEKSPVKITKSDYELHLEQTEGQVKIGNKD